MNGQSKDKITHLDGNVGDSFLRLHNFSIVNRYYLVALYQAIFAFSYYDLVRIGKLTVGSREAFH